MGRDANNDFPGNTTMARAQRGVRKRSGTFLFDVSAHGSCSFRRLGRGDGLRDGWRVLIRISRAEVHGAGTSRVKGHAKAGELLAGLPGT